MNAAEDEIELKFLCEPADLAAVLDAAPPGETRERDLVSTYFDTPEGHLKAARVSLRIREGGDKRVQTLKRGDGFAREEHEQVLAGESLDLSMGALASTLEPAAREALTPVFSVRVRRRERVFDYDGARIELAADEGEVTAGNRRRPISEVELELKGGRCEAMFDLARHLSRIAPLYLSFEGKASQGQALRAGTELQPRRYDKTPLARELTAAEVFQAIARNTLDQIAANGVVLRETGSPDAVHQLRVAVRRTRSAFATFRDLIDDPLADRLADELRWLAHAFDAARDFDVLAQAEAEAQVRDAALAPLSGPVEAARARAHAEALEAAASGRFRELVLDLSAFVETGAWLTAGGKRRRKMRDAPAVLFAAEALDRRLKRVLKRGRRPAELDDEGRHQLRLAAKKLRYTAEAFAPMFEAEASKGFVRTLKRLQDHLGRLNDLATAGALIERLHLEGPALAAGERLMAARSAERRPAQEGATAAMEALAATPPFWRS